MKKTKNMIVGCIGLVLILTTGLVVVAQEDGGAQAVINRAVIKIDSLSCGGCFSTISAGLTPMEGYSGMGANLFRKLIAVDFTQPLTAEAISQKLSEVGYPGTLEAVEQVSQKESFAYLESKRTGFGASGGSCCSSSGPSASSQSPPPAAPQTGGSCCVLPQATLAPTQDL